VPQLLPYGKARLSEVARQLGRARARSRASSVPRAWRSWTSWTNCGPYWHSVIFPNANCQSLKLPGYWDIARSAPSPTHSNVGLERHQDNFDRKRRHPRLEPLYRFEKLVIEAMFRTWH